ncbi:MAG: hypothetical protein L3J66_08045 [Bacteroidales bacterium]|nr:hypothetical protein [Bacteroidales bacterium]
MGGIIPYYDYPNPYSEDDNYKDYYIFYARNFGGLTIGEEEECVDGGEMYYYKINTVRIFEDYLVDHPELVFNECWIVGERILDDAIPPKIRYIHHITKADFGFWVQRTTGDLPVDIN